MFSASLAKVCQTHNPMWEEVELREKMHSARGSDLVSLRPFKCRQKIVGLLFPFKDDSICFFSLLCLPAF